MKALHGCGSDCGSDYAVTDILIFVQCCPSGQSAQGRVEAFPVERCGVVRPSPLQIPLLGTTLLASLPDAVVLLLAPAFPMVLLGLPIWCLLPWLLSRRFLTRISTVTPLYM